MAGDIKEIIHKRITSSVSAEVAETGVLVACSGGADSTALLRGLCHIGITVVVAHCNFNLRGEESFRDADFVCRTCRELGVELLTISFDVGEQCRKSGESIEMACRSLRYDWFRKIIAERSLSRIAVAHNSDDNIETMLLNLFRGTGLSGLTAMSVDNGEVWRPLLSTSRHEILEYLDAIGQDYVTDSSNLTSAYHRNFIRREVIPLIETRWPSVRRSILATRQHLQSAERIYEDAISKYITRRDFLSIDTVKSAPDVAALTFEFLRPISPSDEVLDKVIRHLAERVNGAPHKSRLWNVGQTVIILDRDGLRIDEGGNSRLLPTLKWTELPPTKENINKVFSNPDKNIAYFPYGEEHYSLRFVKPGDRLTLFGGGAVKLSKAMKDAKYDAKSKNNQTVLVRNSDGQPVWAPGLRRGASDLISTDDCHSIWRCIIG